MIENGGLHSVGDVKALILYIARVAGSALDKTHFTEIILNDGLVNYFDFSEGLESLLTEGMLDIYSETETETYILTTLGETTCRIAEKNLPHNVRKKVLAALTRTQSKIRKEATTQTNIQKNENGFLVTCSLREQQQILLEYSVLVPDEMQAHMIAEQFSSHPTEKYQAIMSSVIDESLFE